MEAPRRVTAYGFWVRQVVKEGIDRMNGANRWACTACIMLMLWPVGAAGATAAGGRDAAMDWDEVLEEHPAKASLSRLFPEKAVPAPPAPAEWAETGRGRGDYLTIVAGIVDAFLQDQAPSGAIIDRYDGVERQYSTPAFALAAATLVAEGGRADLLESATRTMSFSVAALANGTAADEHADFYIPMLMHARAMLADRVPPEVSEEWDRQLLTIVPEKTYKDHEVLGNWNIVNVCGEGLRRRAGLVAREAREAQLDYLLRSMDKQAEHFTEWGMHTDGGYPLAYDVFPRMWLEDLLVWGACPADREAWLDRTLTLGGLSTLLLLSPSGEWPCGGRSAQHQWNEAAVALVCEVNAVRWQARGRPDVAGAFKRAAHLAQASVERWQRPQGDLWIVKNRADPALRHGFEGAYSFNAQYNLLTAAMLAMAHGHADDSIAERPTPAEAGSYILDLREPFHKIVAAAGGTYVLIDTGADPRYDATGLQRVHAAGVAISPLSGSVSAAPNYGPKDPPPHGALATGLAWREGPDAPWVALADFANAAVSHPGRVREAELAVLERREDLARFSIRYELEGQGAKPVEETYMINTQGLDVTTRLMEPAGDLRLVIPALVSDGRKGCGVSVEGAILSIRSGDALLRVEVSKPKEVTLARSGPRVPTRNGFMQAVVADLPPGVHEVTWRLVLEPRENQPPHR